MQDSMSSSNGSVVAPVAPQPFAPSAPGQVPPSTGTSLSSAHMSVPDRSGKKTYTIILTILLLIMTVATIVFAWLYIQKSAEWKAARDDVDSQINTAVAMVRAETTTKMEETFAEREKYPYRNFMGPADYGSLGFEYPQTWSVYIAKDAANGGDFEAYLNPLEVEPVSSTTINALRVTIKSTAFDSFVRQYEGSIRSGKLTLETRNVGGVLANLYKGELSNGIRGALVAFKLRDKTVTLQTDAEIFIDEFYKILDSVTLIQ